MSSNDSSRGSSDDADAAAAAGGDSAPAPDHEPAALAMKIGLVAAEAAFASFARAIDVDEIIDGDLDIEGCLGPAEWPVFSLVLDTLAAAEPDDPRTLGERRVDALNDLARICLAAKRTGADQRSAIT
jgi:hypothetical protein